MITFFLIIIAGFFSASMNSVRLHYRKSIYSKCFPTKRRFFDENISWKNKYKRGDRNKGNKFWLSTTFLSFLTDFYSLSRLLMVLSLISSAIFYEPVFGAWDIGILYLIFSISYESFRKFLVG